MKGVMRRIELVCPECKKEIWTVPEVKEKCELIKHVGGGIENTIFEQTEIECPYCEQDIEIIVKWSK